MTLYCIIENAECLIIGFEGDGEVQALTKPGPMAHHEPVAAPVPNETHWGPKKYYFWNHPLQFMVLSQ